MQNKNHELVLEKYYRVLSVVGFIVGVLGLIVFSSGHPTLGSFMSLSGAVMLVTVSIVALLEIVLSILVEMIQYLKGKLK